MESHPPSPLDPVGIFDSGIGGLTVLHRALQVLPSENFVYFADTEHVPYGPKPIAEIRNYILEAAEFLVRLPVKALVLACNTATSSAVNELRKRYNIPILGMEPAVKPAVEKNNGKRVLVLATQLTLKEEKFKDLVARVDNENIVDKMALPELVELAEQFRFDEQEAGAILREKFAGLDVNKYGTVVLGCTHFPFFRKTLANLFPPPCMIIDGNEGTVNHLKRSLEEKKLYNTSGKKVPVRFFNSGLEATDRTRFHSCLDYIASHL
jgi:glutamate racemase